MADVVEKKGREILDQFIEGHMGEEGGEGSDQEKLQEDRVLSRVLLQMEGNKQIYISFQMYIELIQAIDLFFGDDSVEWLWVGNRLAGVAVMLGLRDEAKKLYDTVFQGRERIFGPDHKATQTSLRHALELNVGSNLYSIP
jgi:hypothetical protein